MSLRRWQCRFNVCRQKLNRSNAAGRGAIFLKFYATITEMFPKDYGCRNWNRKKNSAIKGTVWNFATGHISAPDKNMSTNFAGHVRVNWLLKAWNGPNTFPSKIQFGGRRPRTTHTIYWRSSFMVNQLPDRISSRYKE